MLVSTTRSVHLATSPAPVPQPCLALAISFPLFQLWPPQKPPSCSSQPVLFSVPWRKPDNLLRPSSYRSPYGSYSNSQAGAAYQCCHFAHCVCVCVCVCVLCLLVELLMPTPKLAASPHPHPAWSLVRGECLGKTC